MAHLAYLRSELVERRGWLSEHRYADLVALCQFLPGPASSQVGMAVGLLRGGWKGSVAAWIGFTLPSAMLLMGLALAVARHGQRLPGGVLHGLKIAAVAVVAHAVWRMARTLCPDAPRVALALVAALASLLLATAWAQMAVIAVCGLWGWWRLRPPAPAALERLSCGLSRRTGAIALVLFSALLLGLPVLAAFAQAPAIAMFDAFYRSGALVFGGGHVVLPLLQAAVVPGGAVGNAEFLAGYGAVQALPGPLFAFSAYLGTVMDPKVAGLGGWSGGLACLAAIFLPGWLLVVGAMPFWDSLRERPAWLSASAGVNAGVVGMLLAALYDPIWLGAIHGAGDVAWALAGLGLLTARVPPSLVVPLLALAGWWGVHHPM